MKQYVGLDVSLKEVSICVVDRDGAVIAEGKVATDPGLILSWIEDRVGAVERIVHESGPLAVWLTRDLARLGAPVVCIDARAAHKAVACAEAAAIEDELLAIARESELARRLMTVPGVGPIVALNFIATIGDAGRFARATDVGAYLGLTPRRYQSGEVDYSGRISKRGDGAMRALLYEAANVLITRVRRFSPLKAWAVRLAARKGFKKAAVAAARKIAVVMFRLWRDETTFAWTKEELPA